MIISKINGFKLCQENKDFYFVVIPNMDNMVNVSGEKQTVINELTRWKNEIDFDNNFMLEVENKFIEVLNKPLELSF